MNIESIKSKSYDFALRITIAYKHLTEEQRDFIISKEVLKSGTAIGVLISEADRAESASEFAHKINHALKAAIETEYWLRLLIDSGYIEDKSFDAIQNDCTELIKLLKTIEGK